MKKKDKIYKKFFSTNEEYFNFIKRTDVKVIHIETTHNYKIKVSYVII